MTKKSIYYEDVFALYERNKNIYYDCKYNNNINKKCNTVFNEKCYCIEDQNVLPFTIGDTTVPCRLKYKCYINPNESCPICLECISHKSDAYLTSCGHSFHKKCITYFFERKQLIKYASVFRCPMCRTNLGYINCSERYNYNNQNGLDYLENFWLLNDYMICEVCEKSGHYKGMNRNCETCIKYRKFG